MTLYKNDPNYISPEDVKNKTVAQLQARLCEVCVMLNNDDDFHYNVGFLYDELDHSSEIEIYEKDELLWSKQIFDKNIHDNFIKVMNTLCNCLKEAKEKSDENRK